MKDGCETIETKMPPDIAAGNLEDYFIRQKFHALGFAYVSLDLDGFKSGSLNAGLKST